ncbi:hypothetical protein [Kangiella marina]|uniref:Sel1 repeat family protein n=1 Tax=Kangiella marina TaxID=1079178 RepID=A0ABP8IIM9_9GAMM
MTNKIIGLLAAVVIVLALVAYHLWSEDKGVLIEDVPTTPMENTEASQPARATEKTDASVELTDKDEQPTPPKAVVAKRQNESASDNENKEICQLVDQYDDWYPKGDSYESEKFMDEVKAWAFSRGYFETEYSKGNLDIKKRSDYDYYEIDDLEEMAKAGDSMANVRLAYRLYIKGDKDNMKRAQPYCDRAIADGYTALVMCKSSYLATRIYEERRKEGEEADRGRLKALELEYLAWEQATDRLGDQLGGKITGNMVNEIENEFDEQLIKQRTDALVDDITKQRQRLGIELRNHPPLPELLAFVIGETGNPLESFKACFEDEKGSR